MLNVLILEFCFCNIREEKLYKLIREDNFLIDIVIYFVLNVYKVFFLNVEIYLCFFMVLNMVKYCRRLVVKRLRGYYCF